jgi:hypothetical protein
MQGPYNRHLHFASTGVEYDMRALVAERGKAIPTAAIDITLKE